MTKEKTKTCPECASEIPEEAKRCPHCRKNLRTFFGRHPIITFFLALFFLPILGAIFTFSSKTESPKPDQTEYAYNATNGVFQGKILRKKACTTKPELNCYEVYMGPKYEKTMEHPVVNVDVKYTKPVTPPDWYYYDDWDSWE